MKAVTKLKDDARRHELREDWDKAIEVYLQVIRIGEQGETDLELPLYNRLGDLYVRVGKPDDAVLYYEQAADRYAEAGLFNNAIALCNKALRYAPDHLELIRKLGQFSASQGFLTDARRWFLDFAERAARQGRTDEALTALEDFANTAEDADVRELLGRRLHQYGRQDDAVTALRRAYRMYLGEDRSAKAEEVRAFLAEIAPDVSLADEVPEAPVRRERAADDYGGSMLRTEAEADAARKPEADAEGVRKAEAEAEAGSEAEADAEEIEQIDDLVSTAVAGADAVVDEADVLEGFEATSFETAPEDEAAGDVAFDLPDIEPTGPDETETPLTLEEEQALVRDAMPSFDTVESDDETTVELPLLHEDGDTTPDAGPAPAVEVEDPLGDTEDVLLAARAAVAMADVGGAVDRLHALHERLGDAAAFAQVTREVDELLTLAPDDIRLHQVRVEFAERSDDPELRLRSYLELARALERTNARQKAIAMYDHVLAIAPRNDEATRALARMKA
ncbi:MAG: tetratricopeptide repeat protein, partial [Longimicrobiales bacterium]